MKSFVKVLPVLISSLILTACGGGQSSTSDTSSAPISDNTDPVPVTSNAAPVISGNPPISIDEGSAYSFTPVTFDADGDILVFSVENLPSWAIFNTGTGRVSGTPGQEDAGTYSGVTIRVSDGAASATLPAYDIVVNDVTVVPPPDDSTPPPVETAPVLLTANVVDTRVVLTWSQGGLSPDGGYDVFVDGVDTNNLYRTVALTVTVGPLDMTSRHCFTVESRYTTSSAFYPSNQLCTEAQEPANQAPVISGTASASATAGDAYGFTPSASDADNDSLSFSVNNLPSWASFDEQSGAITGTPAESDVGVYSNIVVSVSDGVESVSLAPFSVEVISAQVTTGELTLKWVAPNTRSDGTALTISEIEGYCIYLGESSERLEMKVDLNDGTATDYTISDLPIGTYFVALTVYDTDGASSSYSNTLEVTVTN